ncbi:hypothetical protein [Pseudomonas petrae]|uniref:hypothetical protein n=1 Tax=Pseudomonas petrae TaxID=2912190 RepID=UPI001F44582D|nr:hypothetical protein [Pseudomonas petrae]MCF7558881.1 hypothetical protein [Pseudomonas petrae]
MTARTRPAFEVAHGALLDLESASYALEMIDALLFFAANGKELPGAPEHADKLIDIARTLVADAANTASSNYEKICREIEELRHKTAQSETVARESEVQP